MGAKRERMTANGVGRRKKINNKGRRGRDKNMGGSPIAIHNWRRHTATRDHEKKAKGRLGGGNVLKIVKGALRGLSQRAGAAVADNQRSTNEDSARREPAGLRALTLPLEENTSIEGWKRF